MQTTITTPGADQAHVLDVEQNRPNLTSSERLLQIRQASGQPLGAILRAYVKLALGPGKLSLQDFERLRLFDDAFHGDSKRESYVGQRANLSLCHRVNFHHDWYGVLSNKITSASYLSAFGFPTIPIKAIYRPQLHRANAAILSDRTALEAFLRSADSYPLFGKPMEGFQSLGSIALRRLDDSGRTVTSVDGRQIAIEHLADDIERAYSADGYVFQPLLRPHPQTLQLCGEKISCVRILTLLTEDGPRIHRTCWKIAAGANTADNFWRAGNLLAQIDPETGTIARACSGSGHDFREIEVHPDSGITLRGFQHPEWDAMKALALEGATLISHVPMIGWDIACTEAGPVIVEMNETPDFFMFQLAERRGVVDAEFEKFVAFQDRNAREFRQKAKADLAKL